MPTLPFRRVAAVLAPALSLALLACSRPLPTEEPVRAVKLMTIQVGQMASQAQFAGEVRARTESRLGFRVAGKLLRRQAEVGQRVRAGALLAQLDPQDLVLATESVRAQLVLALTNRDLAAAELQRSVTLKAQNFISGVEIDRRQAALDSANAQVRQAQAQLSAQTNQAGYADLLATASGIVTGVEAEPGQVLAVGASVLRIAHDGPLDVLFAVPESRIASITLGSAAEVRVWSDDTRLPGVVREKAALADPVTRTFLVKLELDAKARLPLGSTVTVVPQALSNRGLPVIKLPTSALKQDGGGSAVWVLDSATMTVRSQPVQVVAADGNEVVVAAGLEPGMQVVTAGVHVLSPGQKVTAYQTAQQPAQQPAPRPGAGNAGAGAAAPAASEVK